ncbi:MAG: hypothetical protein Kow0062_20950 [Acidobacteriota bacterium]
MNTRKVRSGPVSAVRLAILAAMVLTCAGTALGEKPPEQVAQIFHVAPAPGHEAAFEKGLREHFDLHRQHGDDWNWTTWQVVAGEDLGSYYIHSGSHAWADFDSMPEIPDDQKHVWDHISPHTREMSAMMTALDAEISRMGDRQGPAPMYEIVIFRLRPGMDRAFRHAIKRLHGAIVEKNLPMNYSFEWIVAGNRGSELLLAIPRDTWAAFKPMGNFWDAVEEVYGDFEAQMLRKLLGKSIAEERNFVVALREDLSLMQAR